ncbi:hypothetical protein KIN20_015720 [Parelaphostrongylus tenuis]|uniref:Uncharacterized protein n=1 Tax=Parelaphostrongylus tenuis TaxID=148309 RepID=A0AAD5QQ35_PARTN|nr:hypothetical protein KIN20_015720 [Parelaphostrongylus tenuis]
MEILIWLINQDPKKPCEIDREAIIEANELDPTLSTGDLADDFQCSDEQMWKILKDADEKWRKGIWIPHDLT